MRTETRSTFTLTGDDLLDAQEVLPVAITHVVDNVARCIGPDCGGTRDNLLEEIVAVLRAATIAANLGPPGDPVAPGLFHWTEDRANAVRYVLTEWMNWCYETAGDHATETIVDVTPPDAAPFWTECAERAERTLHALDAGRWGVPVGKEAVTS